MISYFRFFFLNALFLCLSVGVHAADYVPGINELPLLNALEVDTAGTVIFDKPDGRIIEVKAMGNIDRKEARQFYRRTVPQLGWIQINQGENEDIYERENELLRLTFTQQGRNTVVLFSLSPR